MEFSKLPFLKVVLMVHSIVSGQNIHDPYFVMKQIAFFLNCLNWDMFHFLFLDVTIAICIMYILYIYIYTGWPIKKVTCFEVFGVKSDGKKQYKNACFWIYNLKSERFLEEFLKKNITQKKYLQSGSFWVHYAIRNNFFSKRFRDTL